MCAILNLMIVIIYTVSLYVRTNCCHTVGVNHNGKLEHIRYVGHKHHLNTVTLRHSVQIGAQGHN